MCQLVFLFFSFLLNSNKESFQGCMNSFIYLVMHMYPNTSLRVVIINYNVANKCESLWHSGRY